MMTVTEAEQALREAEEASEEAIRAHAANTSWEMRRAAESAIRTRRLAHEQLQHAQRTERAAARRGA